MTWTRLPDTLNSDPRFMRLSDAAFRLHVKALVWANQMLTDGLVPEDALDALAYRQPNPEFLVAELVKVGLWQKLPDEDSWQMDWSDQEESENVIARRRRIADKQARYRERKSRHEADDHTLCDRAYCPALRGQKGTPVTGNVTGNETSNVTGRVTHSRPVPSRKDRDRDGGADAAEGPRVGTPPVVTSESEPEDPPEDPEADARVAALVAETHKALRSMAKPAPKRRQERPSTDPEPVGAVLAEGLAEGLAEAAPEVVPEDSPEPVTSQAKNEAPPAPAMRKPRGRRNFMVRSSGPNGTKATDGAARVAASVAAKYDPGWEF